MPYASKRTLPAAVKALPSHAQSIFRKAFNSGFDEYGEERAFKIAWAAVKRSYHKNKEGKWVTNDAFPYKKGESEEGEEEDLPDVCNEDSDDYDEEACAELQEKQKKTSDSRHFDEVMHLDKGGYRMTRDGYMVANARVARTGIQEYGGDEVGDSQGRRMVRVYRPESEVFARDAMTSLAHKPVTLNHPTEMVNASNWRQYAVGHVDGEITRDGDMVRVPLLLMDAQAIEAVRSGVSQLSVGYDAELDWTPGKTAKGEHYDASQKNIRGNHIALTPSARGGPQLKIGDKGERTMERETLTRAITVDGIEIKLPAMTAALIEKALGDSATLKKQVDTLSGTVAALEAKLADATVSDADLDRRVAERQTLIGLAKRVVGDSYKPDGLSLADIRRATVTAKLGDAAKTMSDERIEGAFTVLTQAAPTSKLGDGPRELAFNLSRNSSVPAGSQADVDAAWEERGKFQREAWKQNNANGQRI